MAQIDSMEVPILQSVAYPPTLFYVPFEMAIMNMVVNVVLMLLAVGAFHITPFPFAISIIGMHIFLIKKASQDPHMYNIIRAVAPFSKSYPWQNKYPNYVKESAVKAKFVA